MYIAHVGPGDRLISARIGLVSFSKTGKTLYYEGKIFERIGRGEHIEVESGDRYWITGCRRDGNDRGANNPGSFPIEIDEDVRREYWRDIRGLPDRAHQTITHG